MKCKLDLLKQRGLDVTAIPKETMKPIPVSPMFNQTPVMLNPAMEHEIMTQTEMLQMCNMTPQEYPNGVRPPKVIQGKSIFESTSPDTIYGNPKDPIMPAPFIFQGNSLIPGRNLQSSLTPQQDALDLTCKTSADHIMSKPIIEFVGHPQPASPIPPMSPQNLFQNYTLFDNSAVIGSDLEITLVTPEQPSSKLKMPRKRSSSGKFIPNKTNDIYNGNYKAIIRPDTPGKLFMTNSNVVIPTYQIVGELISPTTSTSSRESVPTIMPLPTLLPSVSSMSALPALPNPSSTPNSFAYKTLPNISQLVDIQGNNVTNTTYGSPSHLNALYNRLSGELKQRQMAMYREFMTGQYRGYPGLPDIDGMNNTPTSNN